MEARGSKCSPQPVSGPDADNAMLMAQRALTGWVAHGPHIIMACFHTTNRRIIMDVIQCYALTNESDENIKEDFYYRLQIIIQAQQDKTSGSPWVT